MPIYEFYCKSCMQASEFIMAHINPPPICTRCGTIMELRPSAPAMFNLRGTGWTSKKDTYGAAKKAQAAKERKDKL